MATISFRVLEKKRRRKLPLDEVKLQVTQQNLQQQSETAYKEWLEKQLHGVAVKENRKVIDSIQLDFKGS